MKHQIKVFLGFCVGIGVNLGAVRGQGIESLRPEWGGDGIRLRFHDQHFQSDRFYELWRSDRLNDWSFENFYFGEASTFEISVQRGGSRSEFFRIRPVDQTAGGIGAAGSSVALTDASFPEAGNPDPNKVNLGWFLFWDKELSGNRNISCATCHHTDFGTGDGLSLPVGEGGDGLGLLRSLGVGENAIHERVPRNAPHLFGMGNLEIDTIFHDGRLFRDPMHATGFTTPAGDDFPMGVESPLAAQAMFPVTSAAEMAGQLGENEIADFAATGDLPGLWEALAVRLRAIPGYVSLFQVAYPEIERAEDLTFVHAANAIGAYEAAAFRADNSPFDRFLRGDRDALSGSQLSGMKLFYGKANCASCHSGVLQTDQKFYAIAMPQIGPGKGNGESGYEDWGRFNFTGDLADKFRFRTPTLRNVALTGPYGHSGAYATLEEVVRHHLNPVESLNNYDPSQVVMPTREDLEVIDFAVMNDARARQAIAEANELAATDLTEDEIVDLIAFLHSLSDTETSGSILGPPPGVPSGLPVVD